MDYFSISSSDPVLIKNSHFYQITAYSFANITTQNTTVTIDIELFNDANGTLINTTAGWLDLQTNGTVYLEDFSCDEIYKYMMFYEGTITGSNETFSGIESWLIPKIIFGSGVSYIELLYCYQVENQVNLTLIDTYDCDRFEANDYSNVTLVRCTPTVIFANQYSNSTLINCSSNYCYGDNYKNVTMFNCTMNNVVLERSCFLSALANSYIGVLTLYDSSDYYFSPDSSYGAIDDNR